MWICNYWYEDHTKIDKGGIVVYKNCAIMTCTEICKVDDKVFCTIALVDQNYCKYQVSVTQHVLGKALKVFMKDKANLLKQLMKNRLKAALNTRDNIISHLGVQNYDQVEEANNNWMWFMKHP